jgi:hypothetical protein
MKRSGLLLTTVTTALLSGWVLHRAGWSGMPAQANTPARVVHHRVSHRRVTAIPHHYRNTQPSHWHDHLLAR